MKCFSFTTAAMFCGATAAIAQETSGAEPVMQTKFLEIIQAGGVMMFPLALISVIGGVLVLLYLLTIRRNAVVSDRFMNAAEAMIRKRDYLGLAATLENLTAATNQAFTERLTETDQVMATIESAALEVSIDERARQMERLSQLNRHQYRTTCSCGQHPKPATHHARRTTPRRSSTLRSQPG